MLIKASEGFFFFIFLNDCCNMEKHTNKCMYMCFESGGG